MTEATAGPDADTSSAAHQTHVAVGYRWGATAAGYHLERAYRTLGYCVTYVGLPYRERPGYDGTMPLDLLIGGLDPPVDLFLWIDSAGRYFPRGIERLPMPTACYLIDVHLGTWRRQAARFFDGVFVAQRDYLDGFRRAVGHDQVYWLPLAAALDVHQRHDVPRIYDVGFVGNVSLAHRRTARVRRLKLLGERYRANDFWRAYTSREVGSIYSQSLIVANTSIAGDVNMRIFEGTACGALVLTDSDANGLGDLFHVGTEIVTYTDDTDLIAKVDYYLSHDSERTQIAEAGYRRTLSEHTYRCRAQTVLRAVLGLSFEFRAPMRRADSQDVAKARQEVLTHLHMLDALLDEARSAGLGPLRRLWTILPCLVRRLLV